MSSIIPSLRESATNSPEMNEAPADFALTYRHWFVVSLLVFLNVTIFGCVFLAILGKVRLGF